MVVDMHARPARPEDRDHLLGVWERSVRATHHFLEESDVAALRPLVVQELASDAVDWWVLISASDTPIGFLGLTTGTIEALFIDPDHHGQGGGRLLVAHAQRPWRSTSTNRMRRRCGSTRRLAFPWPDGLRRTAPAGRSPFCI
jgi:putative acetyltransferase